MKWMIPVVLLGLVGCGVGVVDTEGTDTVGSELKGGCRVVCPKCNPNEDFCIAMACYQECHPPQGQKDPAICGNTICKTGDVCCNSSCGICTPPDGFCTMNVCTPQ